MTNLIIVGGYLGPLLVTGGYASAYARPSHLRSILMETEKISIGEYVFEPDVVEPGIDNYNCHTRRVLAKM